FLWTCVRQSNLLPFGGSLHSSAIDLLKTRTVGDAVRFAQGVRQMDLEVDGKKLWEEIYYELSAEREGITDSITARSQPQVRRLACLYALLDHSNVVQSAHLQAAYAVWQYCEASVRFIFNQ